MIKKSVFFFFTITFSLACCCTSESCQPVIHTLKTSLKYAKQGAVKNDDVILNKELKNIQKLQQQLLILESQIEKLQQNITALRKIQAFYADKISKQMSKRDNLEILLNKEILNVNKTYFLLNKIKYLKMVKQQKNNLLQNIKDIKNDRRE